MRSLSLGLGALITLLAIGLGTPRLHPCRIGDLADESAAYAMGFRSGDQVLSSNGKKIESWEEFALEWSKLVGKSTHFEIERGGRIQALEVTAHPNFGFLESGFRRYSAPPILTLKIHSPLSALGVQDGDRVRMVDGFTIADFRDFEEALRVHVAGSPLNIDLERAHQAEPLSIAVANFPDDPHFTMHNLGLIHPRNVAAEVRRGTVAAKLGVQRNDRFVLIQGQSPEHNFKAKSFLASLKSEKKIKIAVLRSDKVQHLETAASQFQVNETSDVEMILRNLGVKTLAETGTDEVLAISLRRMIFSWQYQLKRDQ